ncbi:hypothetical protein F5Y00DRAFT_271006 [Daldinia vernicosa]|uniref:uncharacterized protein n=1 Tax=Daldinia vernicosa TaxID=114800 RepID=UPI0020089C66|nr:uncharacterized protein F5Y00DRAFT_271006 [Daldinia vernicosa]KAI0847664.1 hypothetical protein F5Y00DRAFT_271006 [Daldinia vernicosa]
MSRIHIEQRHINGLADGIHIGDKNFNYIYLNGAGSQLTLKQFSKQTHEKVTTDWKNTGTCEWLRRKPEFQKWAQLDNSNSFLWMHGFQGCGKTTLMSRAIEGIREEWLTGANPEAIHLLYFYIGYGDDEQNQQLYKTMLMTFCEQVLDGDDARSSDVYGTRPCDEIQHKLNRLLATAQRDVFIVIDALDQLPQEDRRKLLRGLNDLVQERKKEKNEFRLAVIISSRDCTGFDKLREHHILQIQIKPSDNADDIQKYLKMKLDSDLFEDRPDLRERALYELVDKADGMFLWAKLQAENICRINYEQDVLYVLETLILPGDMPKMYERYATGFEALKFQPIEKQIAVRTIALLAQTTGSIQKEILFVALALDTDSGKPDLDLYRLLRDEPARIVRDCKHLVDINEHLGVFRFCHMSIFEFFRAYKPAVNHRRVVQLCLAHLCLSDFSKGSYDDAEWFNYGSLRPVLQRHPFLEFASCNWAASMRKSIEINAGTNIQESHREILRLLERLFAESSTVETWGNLRLSFQIFSLNHGRSITSGIFPEHIVSYFALHEFFDTFREKGWLNPTKCDHEGLTAMHWAIRNEAKQDERKKDTALVVQKLIELGGDMNARDNEGRTPLYYASHYGNVHVVTILLERGAELNTQSNSNETPLIAACRKHHEEVISKLLSAGADVKIQCPDGTALQAIALIGCDSCAELIIDRYGEEPIVEGKGPFSTSLHAAAFHGHARIVQLLCVKGLDIHATDETYGSVLTAAASGCNPIMDPKPFYDIINRMINRGADINDPHGMWGPALRPAAFFGHVELVRLLLEKGAEVRLANGPMGTAYEAADERGHQEIKDLLLEYDPNAATYGGQGLTQVSLPTLGRLLWEVFSMALKAGNMTLINRLVGQYEMFVGEEIEKGRTTHLEGMIILAKYVFIDVIKMITLTNTEAEVRSKRWLSKVQEKGENKAKIEKREKKLLHRVKTLLQRLFSCPCCCGLLGKPKPTSEQIPPETGKNQSLPKTISGRLQSTTSIPTSMKQRQSPHIGVLGGRLSSLSESFPTSGSPFSRRQPLLSAEDTLEGYFPDVVDRFTQTGVNVLEQAILIGNVQVIKLIADTWVDVLNHLLSHAGFGEPLLEKVLQNRTIELKRHLINPELELTERFKRAEGLARVDLGEQGQTPVREIIRIFSTRFSAAVRSRDRINAEICGQAGLEFVIAAALSPKRSLMDKLNEEWARQWNIAVEAEMDDLVNEILNQRWEEYQKYITAKRRDKPLGLAIAAMGTLGAAIQKGFIVVTQALLDIINLGFRWTTSLESLEEQGRQSSHVFNGSQQSDLNDFDVGRVFDAAINLFATAEGTNPNRLHTFALTILNAIESASNEFQEALKELVLQRIQTARKGVHAPELSQYLIEVSTTIVYLLNTAWSIKGDGMCKTILLLKNLTRALPKLTEKSELARYEHAIRFLKLQEEETEV